MFISFFFKGERERESLVETEDTAAVKADGAVT